VGAPSTNEMESAHLLYGLHVCAERLKLSCAAGLDTCADAAPTFVCARDKERRLNRRL